ncbi:MAG TPA: hypothetical protein VFA59_21700 [Vicinamibacterales bacterium]|nr:hypothetical protein [Vicinamibacterales bacterium]
MFGLSVRRLGGVIALAVVLVLVYSVTPAYAYVDPGPAGMLLQFVLGGVAGVLVLVKLCWSWIKDTLFGSARPKTGKQ